MTEDEDTVVRPALVAGKSRDLETTLRRIAASVNVLASVIAGYPTRHTEVWQSAEWEKDLKDLKLACERLRQHAQELDGLAEGHEARTSAN